MAEIRGMTVAENQIVRNLTAELRAKARRNKLRSRYMDGKAAVRALSPMLPPYLRNIGACLGWPAKAVEALARRTRLDGFAIPGSDLASFGLPDLLTANDYITEVRQTEVSALIHAVSWEVVTAGGPGEPDALITYKSALDGTGTWNARTRRLDSFLSVNRRDDMGEPVDFALYLPRVTIIVEKRAVVDRSTHQLWVPVHPVRYKPRRDRVFGQSRITRPVMFLTGAAVKSMLRMEGTADFYGTPHLLLLGATLDQFQGASGQAVSTWDFLMSKINGIPDDDDMKSPRADVKEITQATQQPHLDQLDEIAAAFAGETGIPVSSLGVGVKQANPTSAESYQASREDLIAESEDAQDSFGWAHVRSVQDLWLLASGETKLPAEMLKLRPIWRDARNPSRAAVADSTQKLVTAFPWMAESDAILDTIGLEPSLVERLRAEKARAQARTTLATVLGQPGTPNAVQG